MQYLDMAEKSQDLQKGFLTPFLASVFSALERHSLFEWSRKILGFENTPSNVEKWVLVWFALAILCFTLSSDSYPTWVNGVVVFFSGCRLLEILVYAANTVIFHSVIAPSRPLRSKERYAILLLINYAEIILWFATYYSVLRGDLLEKLHDSVWLTKIMILRESMVIMVANSTGAFLHTPKSFCALAVVTIQMSIGLFMTLLVVARLANLLPLPGEHPKKEQ